VGVRAPSHPVARALLERVGAPLAAPSANSAQHVSPTSAADVLRDLNGRIDAVLDGGRCSVGIESTVLALEGPVPRLLRAGAVSRAELEGMLGPIEVGPRADAAVAQSPGQHHRHYAPAVLVRLVARSELPAAVSSLPGRVGVLLRGDTPAPPAPAVVRLPTDAASYARELYAALRELEDADCNAIVIEQVPAEAEWDAIRDRLARAAAE
jgi:L-threonylcarbamoyladenylate synthase